MLHYTISFNTTHWIIKTYKVIKKEQKGNMIEKSKLSITIHDVEFAKDFQYFITVHYEGMKKQTDLSALARNPIFTNNTFFFDPPSNHMIRGSVVFIANIALEQEEPTYSKKEQQTKAKILGQCTLDLTPFGLQPTESYNLPIRQQMKFFRVKDGKQISVGRFIASFKMVPQEDVPVYIEELEEKKIERNEIFTDLPDYDEDLTFRWRVRVDVREALNVPSLDNMTPQVFVEVGWTEYKDTLPEQKRIFSTSILNTNHPQWNQIFLITNPSHCQQLKGFIMITLKQKNSLQDILRVYFPLQSMGPFVPYNLKLRDTKQNTSPTDFYVSLILQAPASSTDKLHDIIVADIMFDPMITPFKQMNLALVPDSDNQPKINFLQHCPNIDNIQRILEFDQAQEFTYILSQTMKVPPIKSSKQYRAACIFTIPQSFLSKHLSVFVIAKTGKGMYEIGGIVQSIQKDLINMLVQKLKKRLFFNARPHPNMRMGQCQIQFADKQQVKVQGISKAGSRAGSMAGSKVSRRGEETASEKLMRDLNITSNQSLLRHVNQNNEIIARILRELDDKSESLRQAASEISDLRSRVKLLQNQNSILRRKALQEEDELVRLVQKEVDNMNPKELKQKIIKMSQLYKGERVKNRQLEKSIKTLQPQVSNSMQLNSIIANQKNSIQILQDKVQKMKKDNERINIYKETIKKQEKVILKLEKVMKDGMEEVRNARNTRLELEQLKKRGGNSHSHGSSSSAYKEEIDRLQKIIADLQRNQQSTSSKKGLNFSNASSGGNAYELQFKLYQAETRIQSLERQLQERSKSYARQIATYKLKIAQKQAILDGFSQNNSYN